jgi:Mechanosensitive ion channel
VDVHEKHQIDIAGQVARVSARARPWRSIIALALAVAGVAAALWGRAIVRPAGQVSGITAGQVSGTDHATGTLLIYGGTAGFCLFGVIAAFGLSGKLRSMLAPSISPGHASVARYALVLASMFAILLVALDLLGKPVGQLVVGGAVTGVLLGIAAQQSLGNLFAGMVLLFARPFHIGDRVRFRSGALGGQIEGTVIDISITYVRVEAADGVVLLPNAQVLAAAVGPAPPLAAVLADGDAAGADAAGGDAADGDAADGDAAGGDAAGGKQAAGSGSGSGPASGGAASGGAASGGPPGL